MSDPAYRELNRKYARAKRSALRELVRRHDEEYRALYRAERIKQEGQDDTAGLPAPDSGY